MEPFLGEIRAFSFGHIPQGWLPCDGRQMSIQQNQALFSLLGNRYGGNGTTSFNLPDLRGRTPIHFGQGPGNQIISLAELGGTESVTLTLSEMPQHTHGVLATNNTASTNVPTAAALAASANTINAYSTPTPGAFLAPGAVTDNGSGQGHENMQPSLTVSFCIATSGIYPSRN